MPVHYEIYDSRSNNFIDLPWRGFYRREEDAIQAVHGLGFPGVYHVVKVTTESELVYHAEIEETEEFREHMRQFRERVTGWKPDDQPGNE